MSSLVSTAWSDDFDAKATRAWGVAESLHTLLEGKERLSQREAVRHIRSVFGEEFLYSNRNDNPAISPYVLSLFEMFTEDRLIWSKHGRFWRRRKPGDPITGRMARY